MQSVEEKNPALTEDEEIGEHLKLLLTEGFLEIESAGGHSERNSQLGKRRIVAASISESTDDEKSSSKFEGKSMLLQKYALAFVILSVISLLALVTFQTIGDKSTTVDIEAKQVPSAVVTYECPAGKPAPSKNDKGDAFAYYLRDNKHNKNISNLHELEFDGWGTK